MANCMRKLLFTGSSFTTQFSSKKNKIEKTTSFVYIIRIQLGILCRMPLCTICVVLFSVFFFLANCQLVVNVRNNGGDVYRETIEANTTQDSINLDFRKSDGTLITQLIDGRNVNKTKLYLRITIFFTKIC